MPWALHMRAHVCTHLHVNAHACTSLCTCSAWMAKCLLGTARAFHQNIWGCRAGADEALGPHLHPRGSPCPGAAAGGGGGARATSRHQHFPPLALFAFRGRLPPAAPRPLNAVQQQLSGSSSGLSPALPFPGPA